MRVSSSLSDVSGFGRPCDTGCCAPPLALTWLSQRTKAKNEKHQCQLCHLTACTLSRYQPCSRIKCQEANDAKSHVQLPLTSRQKVGLDWVGEPDCLDDVLHIPSPLTTVFSMRLSPAHPSTWLPCSSSKSSIYYCRRRPNPPHGDGLSEILLCLFHDRPSQSGHERKFNVFAASSSAKISLSCNAERCQFRGVETIAIIISAHWLHKGMSTGLLRWFSSLISHQSYS